MAPSFMDTEMIIKLMENTIADTPPVITNWVIAAKQKQEVEQTMFDECTPCEAPRIKRAFGAVSNANAQVIGAVPVEATQRDYAIARVKAISDKHAKTLRVLFNMDEKKPETFLELEAMIKAGDYTVSDKAKSDDARYYNLFYGVTFGKPADKAGYEVAREVLKVAAQKALDKATLNTLDVLEAVIDDFEAWVYTPAA